ncbi:putative receptor protein kinase ZmPK1 [Pistacia vera]|uniref:putative receptor protein kinase ZmPK1 n=1 Tax=Pistacia vera TaxID=55513 RepID=UPI001263D544|nr:putative receptor protein kinase ZmPK1 [Pistacia vera]
MRFLDLFILLILIPVAWAQAWSQGLPSLSHGSSLAVAKENDFLASPKGTFSGGFSEVGTNAYCFAIWFTNSVNKTVVWMANRDKPVNGRHSSVEARLLETGNLVLVNQTKGIIWESFEFPTDTLLPSQPFTKNPTLVSMRSRGTYLSGVYNMKFDDNNVLNLIFNGPLLSSVYRPSSKVSVFDSGRTPNYNSTRKAILNDFGYFESSDNFVFKATDYGVGPKRRLTLDYDGILRLYSLDDSTGLWKISWIPVDLYNCHVHGLCGENGICVYSPQSTCICPDGFNRNDPSDWSKGCSPSFNLTCDPTKLDFMLLNKTDFYGNDLVTYGNRISFEECRNRCLSDCT